MNILVILVAAGLVIGGFAFFTYRRVLRRAKAIERGIKMVPILIHLPPSGQDSGLQGRDVREVLREKLSQAEVLYNLLAGTASTGFKSRFYGQRHIALELVATNGLIHFYAAVPVVMLSMVEQAIVTAYPGAKLEEVEDYNVFNSQSRISGTAGGELTLKADSSYPIATYQQLERDPLEALINAMSTLKKDEGAGIQFLIRPSEPSWTKASLALVKKKRRQSGQGNVGLGFTPQEILKATYKSPSAQQQEIAQHAPQALNMTDLEQNTLRAIEDKTQHPGFETLIRVVTSSANYERSQQILRDLVAGFALFEAPGLNGFKLIPAVDVEGLATAYIFRFFPPELHHDILNSVELATLFHLPEAHFTPTQQVDRQQSKQVDGPPTVPTAGLLLGYNLFRGVKKEIRLSPEDRRRHSYIIGQTGTGKSTMLENLAVQDMLAGNGFAFIDPHGDTAEKLISMVPKNRAEDVIYFNPGDTEHPLGLNLFEFSEENQKDFLIQESINMLYKIYDPGKTGMIGPRFEQWFRNAALTLMSDPAGASFIEIPKVFTDAEYLKQKFKYLKDPTVIDFWTKEMGQTSDYHKSEMLGWFNSKFGAFAQNQIMRNIIGQVHSSFNLRDIMDNKKILIVNLSKGKIGDINSQLLGIMLVIKFQAAAMSRVDPTQRPDFCLYVDEFQNFSTDSFASILSEARKYGLNLIVANQFIGQLSPQIRDAVFGNVGTLVGFRVGPEDAEFLVKQFAPIFDTHDLVNIPNFNAVMKLMIGGVPSQPFSLTALPPLGLANPQLGEAIKQLSAAKFGVNRQQVEAEIFARLSARPAVVQAPASVQTPAAVQAGVVANATPNPPQAPPPVSTQTPLQTPPVSSPVPLQPQPATPTPVTVPSAPVVPAEQSLPPRPPEPVRASQPAPAPVAATQDQHILVGIGSHKSKKTHGKHRSHSHSAQPQHNQDRPEPSTLRPASTPPPIAARPVIEPRLESVSAAAAPKAQPTATQTPAVEPEIAPVPAPAKPDPTIEKEIHSAGLDEMIKIVLPPPPSPVATADPTVSIDTSSAPLPTPPPSTPAIASEPKPPIASSEPSHQPEPASTSPEPQSPVPTVPATSPPPPAPAPVPKPEPVPAPVESKPPVSSQPAPQPSSPEPKPQPTSTPAAPVSTPPSKPMPAHIKEVSPPDELIKAITSTEPTGSEVTMLRSDLVKPALESPAAVAAPAAKPKLAPGEVYIDENGNVVTG